MAISYVGNSTVPTAAAAGTGTTGLSLTPPANQLGDLLLMFVHAKPDTATIVTPDGWTAVSNGAAAGGGGTTGADTGPTTAAWFYKPADERTTAVSVSVTSGNASMGMILCVRSDVPEAGWSVAGANGIDTTTGTPFTAAMNTNPGIDSGDMVLVFGGVPTDVTTPAQFSAETLTATGLTSGSVTEIAEPATTQGNDLGGVLCRWSPTGGPASGVATFSATAGGTTTNVRGPIILARVREAAAAQVVPHAVTQLRAA